ncbi:MAG: hypothetical protein AAF206_16300 [Bacteroidota bacterium]
MFQYSFRTTVSVFCLSLFSLLSLTSCDREEINLLDEVERVLPGTWQIDSIYVVPGTEINYFGQVITEPTTISNLGEWRVPSFDTEDLDLSTNVEASIASVLVMQGEETALPVDKLFLSQGEYFAYFRASSAIETPIEQFVSDVRLFRRNVYIDLIDDDRILIYDSSLGADAEKMWLSRQ